MEEYVDEYNKILTTIFDMNEERVEEDKANWKKFYDSLVIKDINKTIDDKKKDIKKLQDDIIKLENDKEEWKSINFTKKARAECINFKVVGFIHDEYQIEVIGTRDEADHMGKLVADTMATTGMDLGFKIPTPGSYDIGKNWLDTH